MIHPADTDAYVADAGGHAGPEHRGNDFVRRGDVVLARKQARREALVLRVPVPIDVRELRQRRGQGNVVRRGSQAAQRGGRVHQKISTPPRRLSCVESWQFTSGQAVAPMMRSNSRRSSSML